MSGRGGLFQGFGSDFGAGFGSGFGSDFSSFGFGDMSSGGAS